MSKLLDKCYIYELSIDNRYFYIGSTVRNPSKRIKEHLDHLRLKTHCNRKFQLVYNKHKKVSYKIKHCFVNKTLEYLLSIEQRYLNLKKYNLNILKTPNFGKEAVYKILEYTGEGVFIRQYNSVNECALANGIHPTSIRNCIYKLTKTCNGKIYRKYYKGFKKTITPPYRKPHINPPIITKQIAAYDKYGNIIRTFNSMLETAEYYRVTAPTVRANMVNFTNLNGIYLKEIKGEVPKTITMSTKRVACYDKNNDFVDIFYNVVEAAKHFNVNPTNVYSNILGKLNLTKKHRFEYIYNDLTK
jgi:hypothetical protein